jgi:hypothetical protein
VLNIAAFALVINIFLLDPALFIEKTPNPLLLENTNVCTFSLEHGLRPPDKLVAATP